MGAVCRAHVFSFVVSSCNPQKCSNFEVVEKTLRLFRLYIMKRKLLSLRSGWTRCENEKT